MYVCIFYLIYFEAVNQGYDSALSNWETVKACASRLQMCHTRSDIRRKPG